MLSSYSQPATGEGSPSTDKARLSPTDRLMIRWRAHSLDAMIAAGRPTDADRLIAGRAAQLVSASHRKVMAETWLSLLAPRNSVVSSRKPPAQAKVLGAEAEIRELARVLQGEATPEARGIAMAGCILSDGTGPLHGRGPSSELASALRNAIQMVTPTAAASNPAETAPADMRKAA